MRINHSNQRGAAALIVTLLLFFAMLLTAGFVNRNLVFEQRIAANQLRSTQAFEAAEAGLDWAVAMLNAAQRIDADCLPSTDPLATSFRSRYLSHNPATSGFTPVSWTSGTTTTPLLPSCVKTAGAWSCSCPSREPSNLVAPSTNAAAPAFVVQFLPITKPGMLQVRAIGCTSLAGACQPGTTARADGTAQLELTVMLTGGLRTPPAAALTTRGAVDADAASLGLHNPDPATGLAVHAGGRIAASHAQLSGPAGGTRGGTIVALDTSLASMSPAQFFASHFGIDKNTWKAQAGVARVRCAGDCGNAIAAALAAAPGNAMVWVDGDLSLTGPLTLGTPSHPVLLIASGAVHFNGAVAVCGLVYGSTLEWTGAGSGAFVRGAAVSEDAYRGDATPEIAYDTALLAALVGNTGSFTRVSGSWRDF